MKKYCTYLRVSTQKQGQSGLGIDAQRKMCETFIQNNKGVNEHEFVDIESGTHRDRKGLWDAIDYCKKNGCSLVIAKLDRLARDVEFTFKVINTGIDIHFTDMPVVNSMILGVFASVAQYEREMCSCRTRQALAVKKANGYKLGGANQLWKDALKAKTKEEKYITARKKSITNNDRYLGKRDTIAFGRVLKKIFFPDSEKEMFSWNTEDWKLVNTKGDNKIKVLQAMKDLKDIDETGMLFKKWDLNGNLSTTYLQVKLATEIRNIRRSVKTHNENEAWMRTA